MDTAEVLGMGMAVVRDLVVVPVAGYTVGLDAATGAERWRYDAPLDVREIPQRPRPGYVGATRPDADGETVFIPAWGASVSAVSATTGRARWVWTPEDTIQFRSGTTGVRVAGDTVYAAVWHSVTRLGARSEHWLVALDRLTGRELWRVVFPRISEGVALRGAPAVSGNVVIANSVGGFAFAVDRFTRRVVWEFDAMPQQATIAQSEVFGDVTYHDGGDNHLYALRAADGSLVWKAPIDGQPKADFLVTARYVVVPVDARLVVLDRTSGKRIATIQQSKDGSMPFYSPPAEADGSIFISGDGAALCYRAR